MNYDIIEKIKGEIKGFKSGSHFEEFGRVIEAADGIVRISGLTGALSQEILTIETEKGDVPALAFNLEETVIGGVILDYAEGVKVGDTVKKTGR
ncbi:MAG: F0F1 ATP synthase subunit alpha, partial [Patescibacteria group bacterium]